MNGSPVINDGHVHLGMPAHGRATPPDRNDLLARMDAHGVARAAVITPTAHGWDNQVTLGAVRTHRDRFVGIARIDTMTSSAVQDCAALLGQGLQGIRIDLRGNAATLDAPSTTAVLAELAGRRAVLDVHAGPAELPAVARVADRHPDLTVLVDHGGRPDAAVLADPTRSALAPVLAAPNVVVKTPNASHFSATGPPHRDLAPFHAWLVDAVGADRVMWGSDWPVCPGAEHYRAAVAAAHTALAGLSPTAIAAVLGGTFDTVFGPTGGVDR